MSYLDNKKHNMPCLFQVHATPRNAVAKLRITKNAALTIWSDIWSKMPAKLLAKDVDLIAKCMPPTRDLCQFVELG